MKNNKLKLRRVLEEIPKKGFSKKFQKKGLKFIIEKTLISVRPVLCARGIPEGYPRVCSIHNRFKKLGYEVSD